MQTWFLLIQILNKKRKNTYFMQKYAASCDADALGKEFSK